MYVGFGTMPMRSTKQTTSIIAAITVSVALLTSGAAYATDTNIYEELQKTIENLKDKIKDQKKTIKQLKVENEKLTKENEKLKAGNYTANDEITKLEKEIKKLKNQLEKQKQKKQNAKAEVEALRGSYPEVSAMDNSFITPDKAQYLEADPAYIVAYAKPPTEAPYTFKEFYKAQINGYYGIAYNECERFYPYGKEQFKTWTQGNSEKYPAEMRKQVEYKTWHKVTYVNNIVTEIADCAHTFTDQQGYVTTASIVGKDEQVWTININLPAGTQYNPQIQIYRHAYGPEPAMQEFSARTLFQLNLDVVGFWEYNN